MKTFYHYLAEAKKEYSYKIKLISAVDDAAVSRIERALVKYDIISISKPKKTILQAAPLDFKRAANAEVWIIDLVTHLPASSYMMWEELRSALGIHGDNIVVRGFNEPMEIESQRIEAQHNMDKKALEDGLIRDSLLGADAYEEHEPAPGEVPYGDAYNRKLLNYLSQVQANRPQNDEHFVEPKNALFKWLAPEAVPAEDFNKDFDTVKPVNASTKKPGAAPVEPTETSAEGNITRTATSAGVFKDRKGNRKILPNKEG
jgi:hypothetical protein